MKKRINVLLPLFLIFFLAAADGLLAREGRARISTLNETYYDQSDLEAEIVFGRDLAARILGNYQLLDNDRVNRYVNLVGNAVALYAGRPEIKFHFAVLDSAECNAFAAPGGYVFITRGALDLMENEAQLAGVLGHEIAHINEKHIIKELKIRGQDDSVAGALGNLIGGSTDTFRKTLEQAMESAADILFNRGYKMEDELAADQIGLLMASLAGYNPAALGSFLAKARRFEPEDATYTDKEHPLSAVRLAKIGDTLKTNGMTGNDNALMKGRFDENIHP
ncbi:MAG: M48 family metalloprotease [Thermodesulfobacteriota bacterium]